MTKPATGRATGIALSSYCCRHECRIYCDNMSHKNRHIDARRPLYVSLEGHDMTESDNDLKSIFGHKPTQQELASRFRGALAELNMTPAELAEFMSKNNDPRDMSAILRGIQRTLAEDTRVSGELMVIVNMLLLRHRRLKHRYSQIVWQRNEHGVYWAQVDGWYVYIVPQSKGRWQITCRHGLDPKDYSPPFSRWYNTLEEARNKAWAHLEDGMNEEANNLHTYAALHSSDHR